MKGLLEKINENCKFIEDKRKNIQFSIKDKKKVVSEKNERKRKLPY